MINFVQISKVIKKIKSDKRHVDIQRLRLVNVNPTVGGHVDERPLLELPRGAVEHLEVGRDLGDVLHRAVVRDDLVAERANGLGVGWKQRRNKKW